MKTFSSLLLALTFCFACGLMSTSAVARTYTDAELHERAMDQGRTLQSRIRALKKLYAHLLVDGEIPSRTVCVWDVLGNKGPIYTATVDQKLRLSHYGIKLEVEAFTNEQDVVDKLRSGHCDTSVMSGAKAREFNDFTASIEALGGGPSRQHMKYLLQVLSSPYAHKKMIQGDFHVVGIIPLGFNYLFTHDSKKPSLKRTLSRNQTAAVIANDASQNALFNAFNIKLLPSMSTASSAGAYNLADADLLMAPLVAYNMFNLGKGLKHGSIVDYPLSQMTLQIVSRLDTIPLEVGQFLREDMFVKLNMFYRETEKNSREIPKEKIYPLSSRDVRALNARITEIRQQLTQQGDYHPGMMKLQKKIRCKIDKTLQECKM